ncbi:MAG: hypothetical protein NC043_08295 [Muribaculaceae bacterium]|nr:hypothetical protein [Muribaculaceae bacterium]
MDNELDIQKLRDKWKSAAVPVSPAPSCRQYAGTRGNTPQSYRTRLMRRSRALMILCLCNVAWIFPLVRQLDLNVWFAPALMAYFLIMSALVYIEYRKLSRIDLGSMAATDALESVYSVERYRKDARIAGMSMAIPLVAAIIYICYHVSMAAFYGSIAGLVIGLVAGSVAELRTRRWLRNMRRAIYDEIYG